jgi:hypothetical protein
MSEQKQHSTFDIVVGIATIIGAIAIVQKLFSKDKNDENELHGQQSRDELYKKIKPSYADYQYLDFAKTLNQALMLDATENEQAVYNVFNKFKNVSDLVKTVEFFGTSRKMFTTQYVTLPEAITAYFNDSEKKRLNTILKNKRIDYTFN